MDDCNRLSPIMTGDRSEHESEETDEAALNVPRVNSQVRIKSSLKIFLDKIINLIINYYFYLFFNNYN